MYAHIDVRVTLINSYVAVLKDRLWLKFRGTIVIEIFVIDIVIKYVNQVNLGNSESHEVVVAMQSVRQ